MKVYCASNYDEIKRIVNDLNYETENATLFRGTSGSLVPSIVEKCAFNSYADLFAKEHFLLSDFNNYSHIKYEFKEKISQDWEVRIAAREHGLASSLIDWSNSLDVALEFAIHNFEEKKINFTSLWILKKAKICQIEISNEMPTEDSFQEISRPLIIRFVKYSELAYWRRKFIQGGDFLKQSYQDITIPMDKNPIFSDILVHIIIPKTAVPDIWKQIALKVNLDLNVCQDFSHLDKTLDEKCVTLNEIYR